jgi:nucleotide-binding universal stress UspA family protein
MLRKVAIKVSLTEPSAKLLDMVEFLKYFGTETAHLVHVLGGGGRAKRDKARAQIDELAASVEEIGIEPHAHLKQGHVATQVIKVARQAAADYICFYWMPKRMLKQALFGSIDSDIMRMSDKPILVHNRWFLGGAPTELESVLYATDFKATDREAMRYLTNKDFRAKKLIILHAGDRAPDPVAEQERRGRAQKSLERLADGCRDAYHEIETVDVIGRARKQVLKQARANDADLIVIGKSDNPDPLENLLGSTAETVARKARRSVFIVPSVSA